MIENDKNKDPLEQFFQKKTAEYDISFNESDWLKLEKELDIRDVQYAYQRRLRWIAAAAILIVSMLGYFTYDNRININRIDQQLNEGAAPLVENNPVDEVLSADEPSVAEDFNVAIGDLPDDELVDSGTSLFAADDQKKGPAIVEKEGGSPVAVFTAAEEHRIDKIETLSFSRSGSVYPEGAYNTLLIDHVPDPVSATLYNNDAAGRDRPLQDFPRISASMVMSPDISTVGSISNFYDPGYKIGVNFEYNLSRNLAVSVGVVHSKVQYIAYGAEYNPSSGYLSNVIIPDETTAVCFIIDIPVSLKYNVLNFSRSRFFATTGVSSYIMLNEDYQFSYRYNDPGLEQGWSGNTGTTHWISNAGLSIGYEFDLDSNWSLRAEPFLKIPISEVGRGNVRLYSMGSFFSVNYHFTKSR